MVSTKEERSLEGIGGWLILILLGLVVTPIRLGSHLLQNYAPLFSDGTWEQLTTSSSDVYHPLWGPVISFEIVGNLITMLLGLVALYFFLRKSKHTPKAVITWLVTSFIFVVADYFLADMIPIVAEQPTDLETVKEVTRSVVGAAIWVPYFLISKRVKATFIR